MKLRRLLLLMVLVWGSLLLMIIFVSTRALTYRELNEIEERLTIANVRRALNVIDNTVAGLERVTADWAYWDDKYRFLQDRNQVYIDSNLPLDTFANLQVSLLCFFDKQFDLVWGGYTNGGDTQLTAIAADLAGFFRQLLTTQTRLGSNNGFSGLVLFGGSLYLIATRPVLTSEREGPSTGWMITGKILGGGMITELRSATELDLSITVITGESAATATGQAEINRGGAGLLTARETGDEIIGTGEMIDIQGIPVGLLTVRSGRPIYLSGVEATRRILVVIVLMGLLFGCFLWWFLERKILARIGYLNDQVSGVGNDRFDRFTVVPGDDEISTLSASMLSMLREIDRTVSDLKSAQESLTVSRQSYKSLFMNAGIALAVIGENTTILLANQEFYKRLKIPEGERIEGISLMDFFAPDEVERLRRYHYMRRMDESLAPRSYETRFIDRMGRLRQAVLTVAMVPGTQNSSCSLLDVTDQKKAEEQLVKKAFFDSLTELPNRQLFNDRLNHEILKASREGGLIGVFLLDIDEFKSVNDTLGHQAGDQVLRQIAARMKAVIRRSDTLARFGGDEFALMIEAPDDAEHLRSIAEKLIAQFETPYVIDHIEFHLGVSVGIATFPEAGDTPDLLLKNADLAMYESKLKGKNRFNLFSQVLDEKIRKRNIIDRFVRQSIADESFELFYQPKLVLADGSLWGAEALVRGRDHHTGQFVSPGEFIPYAEENGLIVPIDMLVLKSACAQLAGWHAAGLIRISVAVNISTKHFRRAGFVEEVQAILDSCGLEPKWLELEITEGAMMKDLDQAVTHLIRLRDMGVSLALDDFGTGYSSLNYLNNLPVQTLKIDKSFIDHIVDDNGGTGSSFKLVSVIVSLVEAMGLELVAEGVETVEQLRILRRIGCRQGQGYLFARPLPADDFGVRLGLLGASRKWNGALWP